MTKNLKVLKPDLPFWILLFIFFSFFVSLAIFRDTVWDETLYAHETFLMSQLLKDGLWFGDYAVGLHGFLFKIPPAIVFLFTKPSILILTIYNILIGCFVCILFYKLLREAFHWRNKALLALGILLSHYHFVQTIPTYLRETPSLLVVILLLYGIYKNWKPLLLGIIFLLLLDVKEYLFFMFGIGYFIWIIVKNNKVKNFKNIFYESIQIFTPSAIYIILMFTTSFIPINMFLASILGLIDSGLTHNINAFTPEVVATNLTRYEGSKEIISLPIENTYYDIRGKAIEIINTLSIYLSSLFHSWNFSFISTPKILMFPSIYIAFKHFRSKKYDFKKAYSILFFIFLIIYFFRASDGRYLLPIAPLIAIYFTQFIYYPFKKKTQVIKILSILFIFIFIGFFFESSYVLQIPTKIILEILLFLCICISMLIPFSSLKNIGRYFKATTICLCAITMFSTSVYSTYRLGQIEYYKIFGENREISNIVKIIPKEENIWVNNIKSYELFLMESGQTYAHPEWKWELAEYVPKKALLKTYGDKIIHNDLYSNPNHFKNYTEEKNIKYIVFIKSEVSKELFEFEEFEILENLRKADWVTQKTDENLKNKKVFIFEVNL